MKGFNVIKDFQTNSKRYIRLVLTGFAMGTADLIPGVSGGTIAFLSGIYEELLYSIKIITGQVLKLVLRGKITEAIQLIPFRFGIPLAIGLFSAVLTLANLLSWLLANHPVFVWSFFFGLVLASTLIVLKRVVKWDISDKAAFIASTIAAYVLMGVIPVETPNTLPFIFFSGALAICAMILPGISGSFILLLLGKYHQILGAVTERDFLTLGVFMAGCIVGLALFSRFLSWLFAKHHDISVAILAGFMLGSVRKIWPWKEVVSTRINSHGEVVPFIENNILPSTFDISVVFALLLCAVGIYLVFFLDRVKAVKDQDKDIENTDFSKTHKQALKNQ